MIGAIIYWIISIPFILGCVFVDMYLHSKGKGRVDKMKKERDDMLK
jgi:hypothetical protein